MAEPNVIVLIYDGSVQGKGASKYDLYDIQEGIKGDGTLRCPYLPPAPPFYVARVWGVTKSQVVFLMASEYAGKSMVTKRPRSRATRLYPRRGMRPRLDARDPPRLLERIRLRQSTRFRRRERTPLTA